MVIAHTASAFWHHFHPWITKNMDLETVSHLGTQNNTGDSPNDPKIDKNGHLDLQVPVGCPRGSLDHQNDHSGYPRWSLEVPKMAVLAVKSDTVQQSTSHQFPAAKGAGGRGEALKSAALVRPLRCTAHGVSGSTPACLPPVRIRVRLRVTPPFQKANVTLVTFARACRNAVLAGSWFSSHENHARDA